MAFYSKENSLTMLITIFTPTYNRAHLLPHLYESIVAQTFSDFEWIIVDDGSVDDTAQVIQSFIAENKLTIRYFHQSNSGKHVAINKGVCEAQGELFFIADSDDTLPCEALQIVADAYKKTIEKEDVGGVVGFDATPDGQIIGGGMAQDELYATTQEAHFKYALRGDMKEVFRTQVLREFPFPKIIGERFCPEALVWGRIAQKYKMLFVHQIIYIADYQDGGLTDNIIRIRMHSPIATLMHYSELASYDIPFMAKLKAAINYWRFRPCVRADVSAADIPRIGKQWLWVRPLAYLMHIRDKQKTVK